MSCFILRRGITGAIYSIQHNDKPTVVAFQEKRHAGTLKRLVNEMNGWEHKNQLRVDTLSIEYMERTCKLTSLDLIVYDSNCLTYEHFEAITTVSADNSDDIRFVFENRFRYGN